jgi:hypothetical protein
MATHNVAAGEIGAHAFALAAGVVDTVTFADDLDEVTVIGLDGSAAVYFTLDGSTPTVGGANTYVLPAAVGTAAFEPATSGHTVVKLISAATPTISVQRSR